MASNTESDYIVGISKVKPTTTFDEVINVLNHNYALACEYEYVNRKFSWALYQTWKYFDSKEN